MENQKKYAHSKRISTSLANTTNKEDDEESPKTEDSGFQKGRIVSNVENDHCGWYRRSSGREESVSIVGNPLTEESVKVAFGHKFKLPFPDDQSVVEKGHQLQLQEVDFFDGDSGGQGVDFDAVLLLGIALLGQHHAQRH